mgnify:FL=1
MRDILEKFEHAIIAGDAEASVDLADAIVGRGEASSDQIFERLSSTMEVVVDKY